MAPSALLSHLDMMSQIFRLYHFLRYFRNLCGICFSFLQRILAHQNFAGVHHLTRGRHLIMSSTRLCLCRRFDMVVGVYSLLICPYCDKNNISKRLEFLPFHNPFSTTPTRRVRCLSLHPHPRDPSSQHPPHLRTRLC